MAETTSGARTFLDSLLAGAATGSDALKTLRARALERANALSVPTTRHEEWRFTDLTPLSRMAFRQATAGAALDASAIAHWTVPEAATRLVFVDGHFSVALSSIVSVDGVRVERLADAFATGNAVLASHLGQIAGFEHDPFVAANTARLADGVLVHATRNAVAAQPIHCLFVSTQADVVQQARVLVVAEDGASVTILEDHVATHDGAYCVNAVVEIDVGANARVRHVKLQRDGKKAYHLATTAARVARDGTYSNLAVTLGARLSRNNVHVLQGGTGTHFELDGLALIDGRQLADTRTFVDHAQPHGTSRQLHKCVVGGGAHAVFNGRILVREDAQKTDSTQESRNLLLSDKAHVDTKPQLEIFADDVKCAHGAAVGQLEAEEVFYLMSRGLSESVSRSLLTYGFAADIVGRIGIPSIVRQLDAALVERTGGQEIA